MAHSPKYREPPIKYTDVVSTQSSDSPAFVGQGLTGASSQPVDGSNNGGVWVVSYTDPQSLHVVHAALYNLEDSSS
jgi:hypothetical protein